MRNKQITLIAVSLNIALLVALTYISYQDGYRTGYWKGATSSSEMWKAGMDNITETCAEGIKTVRLEAEREIEYCKGRGK